MFEGTDTPDAGVTDDAGTDDIDAGLGSGGRGDAGNPATGGGGGCCQAGGDRPDVWAVVLVAWFLTRRRGTTV